MKTYKIRVEIESVKGGERSTIHLGNVDADSINDIVKVASEISLSKVETPLEVHNRLVEAQNAVPNTN